MTIDSERKQVDEAEKAVHEWAGAWRRQPGDVAMQRLGGGPLDNEEITWPCGRRGALRARTRVLVLGDRTEIAGVWDKHK